MARLDEPFTVGGLTLPNRIVMAPMTRTASPGGVPGPDVAEYYARRAAHRVGLIITEGTYIGHPSAPAYDGVPEFHGEQALAGWAHVLRRVHEEGGRIIPQLWHTGAARTATDPPAEGPSGIGLDGAPAGRAMTRKDIDASVEAFAVAAANAARLGFDGVELHGAHGYLIDDFLWTGTNRRTDRYGGDPASRARFGAEVVRAVRAAVGPRFPVFFRFSQWKLGEYGARTATSPDELRLLLEPLASAGVDVFHASTRRYWLPEFEDSDSTLNLAGWIRKLTGRPTVAVGSVGMDQQYGEGDFSQGFTGPSGVTGIDELVARLDRDEFDLVAVGRSLLANPDWAALALRGELDRAVPYDPSVLRTLA
ncbi:NADH:flavin oxidoreductase [Streptomyces anulatus]|uniref:NADH:flavin oxidoreductase n=1 Tax=Streptomyces TaxID=1883 RepID=UPI0006DB97AC|nr:MULTISPECIES: NADH:flavin oxidoreductase [Streptomyces]KPL30430.1 1,2-oxophytodienoate reductase [Streptomyces anulatus]KQX30491.1 1,2-oxophytodienoate reductase [Streptomyces sp. Root1295]KRA40424.1 1,2-oxophytodienoate reductase [Streptomyces sp. Root63]MBT1100016.1 NADH:flavin oxidoreductase [Streptomyces sp. Tu10]OKI78182.1 1,2-oxophytodienoate reductase [Streptomyces sp. TSRI0395]